MNDFQLTENQDQADFKTGALTLLTAAGLSGLPMSRLAGARQDAVRARQKRWLAEMEEAGEIQVLRKSNTTRYWLSGQMPTQVTPEEKADEVLRRVLPEQRKGRLLTLSTIKEELLKGQGIKDAAIRTCLRILEQERLLVKLTAGSKAFYAYAPALRAQLAEGEPVAVTTRPHELPHSPRPVRPTEAPLPVTNQRVIEAYRSVRMQRRQPDVEIARLQEVLNCPVEELKIVVKRLCEMGTFIPGKGDWSFATPAARAASVMIHDEPQLFVRMKQ